MSSQPTITYEEQELIDAYLAGEISGPELELFNDRMTQEPDWKQKIEWVQLSSVAIAEDSLRQQLDRFHEATANTNSHAVVRKMPAFRKWIAAAAVLAVVFLAGKFLFFNQSPTQQLYSEFYQQDPGLATEMGVSDNYAFDRAMVDYKTGEFANAIAAWKNLLAAHLESDTLHYFIGSAQMGNKEWEAALESFNKVLNQPASAFKNEAHWYKGLLLLQLNRKNEAIESIEAGNHPQKEALISKLKK